MHWSTWKSFVKDLQPYCDKSTLYQHCTLAIFQIKREINLASESHHTRPCRGRHVCSMTFVFFLIDYCNPQSFGLQSKLLDLFSFLAMRVAYSVPLIWRKKAQMSHFSQYLQRSFGEIWVTYSSFFLPIIWTNVSSILVNPAPFLLKRKVQSIKFVKKRVTRGTEGWLNQAYSCCCYFSGFSSRVKNSISS